MRPPAPQAQDAAAVRPTSAVPAPKLILWPPRRDRRCSRAARRSSGRTAVPSPPGQAGRLCRRPAGDCRWGGPSLPTAKYRHRAVFGISVQQRCWGLGLSSVMRDALLSAARSRGYTQFELEVDARNGCGLALYQKFGFSLRYPPRDHLLPRYRRVRPPGGPSPAMRLYCHTALKKREQTDRPALSLKVNAQWQWRRE